MNVSIKDCQLLKKTYVDLKNTVGIIVSILCMSIGCTSPPKKPIHLITLDPAHFHAALVQKSMYPEVDSVVHVYAPEGNDLKMHIGKINAYNHNPINATNWEEKVYEGSDYLQKMLNEKKGNLVVLAGNNRLKTDYILSSVKAGLNVVSDKPMAIDESGFAKLQQAFDVARQNKVQLYDIMTERYEITTILQKAFSMDTALFGTLEKGTPDNPAVTKESVHHFFKYVSGSILTRPPWFFDVGQEGEGIVDVTTHLVDLVQWECFPEVTLDYTKDINIVAAKSWNTAISKAQFNEVTKIPEFPEYLKSVTDSHGNINVLCNGEINYTIKGVHAKVSVIWNFKAPEGTGDTHYSIMRGTKANLIIRQGAEEQFKPTLYIEPLTNADAFENTLQTSIARLNTTYKGLSLKKVSKGWALLIPDAFKEGHEAHFARVMEKYLEYLQKNNMPDWEIPNMLTKYFITTQAKKLASKK